MFGVKTRFDSLPVVVAFVSLLLTGLAYVQYRWTGELSEAESGRMRASLHERATQMARELDREVTRAFMGLSVDAETLRSSDYSAFAERYDRWRALAADPALVKDVYLVKAEGGVEAEPLRYSPERRTFEPADWPAGIAAARDRAQGEVGEPRPRAFLGPLELLEDGTPIARQPTPRFERGSRPPWGGGRELAWAGSARLDSGSNPPRPGPGAGGPPLTFGVMRVAGFCMLVFDKDVIVSRVLPRLAARHFPEGAGPGFEWTVERRDRPGEVVYRSEGGQRGSAEARAGLLELRFEEVSPDDLRALGGPFVARFDGPRLDGRAPPPDRRGFPGRIFRGPGPEDGGLWLLQASYRGSSVEALVAAARRRNLAVSFSVLLLLGAATVLLASAARRARRMAERQMEFVAAVSHELRTPVSVICSAGENLADGVITGSAGVARYGELVRDEGRRLARLIEQILDFAGSYTGRRSYKRELVAVGPVLDEALAAAAPFVKDAGFQVARDEKSDLPLILGDAPALARAVRNLVENAVKYGGEDRTVTVRARDRAEAGRAFVRIEVEDKGLGIPAAEQKQLFEPFWRGAEATSRQIRGSGLGLALVRSIARAHGGDVAVESQLGRGSVFAIELPAAERPLVEAEAAARNYEPSPESSGAKNEKAHDDIAHPAG